MKRRSESAATNLLWLLSISALACSGRPGDEVAPSAEQPPAADTPAAEEPPPPQPVAETPPAPGLVEEVPMTFAVYSLSRGKGVPPAAREVMKEAEALVEKDREAGVAVESQRTRLGLEGEMRLCIEYGDRDAAARAFRRIREMAEDVDLLNLVAEPCRKDPEKPEPESQKED